MADKRVTELNLHTNLELSDVIPIVNNSETKKVAYGSIYNDIREGLVTTGSNTFNGDQIISGSLTVNQQPVMVGQLSWARYDDTQYTTSSFYSVNLEDGEQTLPNNGGFSVTTHLHSTVQFYNTGSQKIYAENDGDVYSMTVTFRAKALNANEGWIRIQMDSAGSTPYRRVGKDLFFGKGNNIWHDYHEVFQFYADEDFVTNGNQWKIRANGAEIDIANVIYFIQRTQHHII